MKAEKTATISPETLKRLWKKYKMKHSKRNKQSPAKIVETCVRRPQRIQAPEVESVNRSYSILRKSSKVNLTQSS